MPLLLDLRMECLRKLTILIRMESVTLSDSDLWQSPVLIHALLKVCHFHGQSFKCNIDGFGKRLKYADVPKFLDDSGFVPTYYITAYDCKRGHILTNEIYVSLHLHEFDDSFYPVQHFPS